MYVAGATCNAAGLQRLCWLCSQAGSFTAEAAQRRSPHLAATASQVIHEYHIHHRDVRDLAEQGSGSAMQGWFYRVSLQLILRFAHKARSVTLTRMYEWNGPIRRLRLSLASGLHPKSPDPALIGAIA